MTARATQPDLFARPVVHSRATSQHVDTSTRPYAITPFNFAPGPECDPDPTYTPPEWLRLPTDQPRPIAEPVARILIRAVLARLQRRLS
jgi:hypothetical protein